MKNFKTTTVTMCCELTSTINLEPLSKIIPVKIVYDEEGQQIEVDTSKKKGNKITFYGTNSVIISCGYEGTYKGVRKGGRQLHKVIGIDLQIGNKNLNLKISNKKLQLTGGSSKDNGVDAFEKVCSVVNQLQTKINYFKKFSKKNLQIIQNTILFNHRFEETKQFDYYFSRYISPLISNGEEESVLSQSERERIIEKYTNRYRQIIDDFKIYSSSPEEDSQSLEEILNIFFSGIRLIEGERSLSHKNVRVINLLAMNKINVSKKIPILHVISAISETFPMLSKGVEEANRFHIKVPLGGNKNLFHKFNFFATGTIRQHSPSDEKEAFQIHSEIMEIVKVVLDKWNIEIMD